MEPKKNQRKPATNKKRHPNWGGRRLGAGAKPGNMNALKHGRRSERMARFGMILAANRHTQAMLLALAGRSDHKRATADKTATYIMAQILERGLKRGDARLEEFIEKTLGRSIEARPPRRPRRSSDSKGNLDGS